MRAQFIRGEDPKKTMKIGEARFEKKVEELQSKKGFVQDEDFEDDKFIVYLFKKDYDNWLKKSGSKLEDVIIWNDTTSGNSSIIKIKAPGVRETTLLRGESYYDLVENDIIELLNSPEIKKKIADDLNKKNEKSGLGQMIFKTGKRKKFHFGSISVAFNIARRLIELLK